MDLLYANTKVSKFILQKGQYNRSILRFQIYCRLDDHFYVVFQYLFICMHQACALLL